MRRPSYATEEKEKQRLRTLVIIDGIMILLLLGNLAGMVFDWFFAFPPFHEFFQANSPRFYRFYEPVHLRYWSYDLIFTTIYLLEFFLRWYLSVRWHEYHRWFSIPPSMFMISSAAFPVPSGGCGSLGSSPFPPA